VEDLSPNLSPMRREALTLAPSLLGKGARGLGLSWIFPHGVKSQVKKECKNIPFGYRVRGVLFRAIALANRTKNNAIS
jgi:hypothetical protein